GDIPQFDIAAPGRDLQLASAFLDINVSAACFQRRPLGTGNENNISAPSGRIHLSFGVGNVNPASAGFETQVPVDGTDLDAVAASLSCDGPTDVVKLNFAATTLRFYAAGNSVDGHAPARCFDLGEIEIPG